MTEQELKQWIEQLRQESERVKRLGRITEYRRLRRAMLLRQAELCEMQGLT